MQPDHQREAEPLGILDHGERLGQAAGLVELDVDRVVFADERRQARRARARSRRRRPARPLDARQHVVATGRQRLLDQRDAGVRAGGEVVGEVRGVQPSLASTISSALGAARRTAMIRAGSPALPSLTLSSARRGCLGSLLRHRCRARRARSCRR